MLKKKITLLLAVAMMATSLPACSSSVEGDFYDDDDETVAVTVRDTAETSERAPLRRAPQHNLSQVDAVDTFDDFYVEDFDHPWGEDKNFKMAGPVVRNYFRYMELDSDYNMLNENMNNEATVTKPAVMRYPADEEGYEIYEVTYIQTMPVVSKGTKNCSYTGLAYHEVGFLDYYTGNTFPAINMGADIDSFAVTGNVHYQGTTYNVGYYEFREGGWHDDTSEDLADGGVLVKATYKITATAYFVVPKGYDGIMMYVYVVDDTNTPVSDIRDDFDSDYKAPESFDEKNIGDYEFFIISASK